MSRQVAQWMKPARAWSAPMRPLLQRKCACGSHLPGGGGCSTCSPTVGSSALDREMPKTAGQPLDSAARAAFAPRFGHDFSDVRIHNDPASHEAARSLNARAFTVGRDVHFASGQYDPRSIAGQRLIAHELAHTIQQRSADSRIQRLGPDERAGDVAALEREADQAADAAVAGLPAPVTGSAGSVAAQREDSGKPAAQPPKIVEPVEPTAPQKKLIDDARRAAAIRTQTARFKASGINGPEALREARELARIKFDWPDPNMDQINDILADMGGGLISVDVKAAGANDPDCGQRAGYVRGNRPPIVLCPAFFRDPADDEGRIRTMIHEMAHTKGIGKADPNEQYFMVFDCTSTGAFGSADAWANYVHCLSGQTPDKPVQIKGKPGGSPPPAPGPKK